MKFAPLDPSIGAEVLFYDPQRREPMTLRRAQLAGKSTTSTGWHLLVFNDPEIDVKSDRRDPTEIAYDVELIASAEKVPSPIARCCWPDDRPEPTRGVPPKTLADLPIGSHTIKTDIELNIPVRVIEDRRTPVTEADLAAPASADIRAMFSAGRLEPFMPPPDGRPHVLEAPGGRCLVAAAKESTEIEGTRFAALDQDGEAGALRWTTTVDGAHVFKDRAQARKAAGMMPAAFIGPITVPSRGKGGNQRRATR
jgi:hypothetical protein